MTVLLFWVWCRQGTHKDGPPFLLRSKRKAACGRKGRRYKEQRGGNFLARRGQIYMVWSR